MTIERTLLCPHTHIRVVDLFEVKGTGFPHQVGILT